MAGIMSIAKGGTVSKGKSKSKGSNKLQAKYENALNRIKRADIKAKEGAQAALGLGEVAGSAYLASLARGYMGPERFQVANIDLALVGGAVGSAYNLMQVLRGKGNSHISNVAAGLLTSGLVGLGERMGANMAAGGSLFGELFGNETAGAPFAGRPVYAPGMGGMAPQGF